MTRILIADDNEQSLCLLEAILKFLKNGGSSCIVKGILSNFPGDPVIGSVVLNGRVDSV